MQSRPSGSKATSPYPTTHRCSSRCLIAPPGSVMYCRSLFLQCLFHVVWYLFDEMTQSHCLRRWSWFRPVSCPSWGKLAAYRAGRPLCIVLPTRRAGPLTCPGYDSFSYVFLNHRRSNDKSDACNFLIYDTVFKWTNVITFYGRGPSQRWEGCLLWMLLSIFHPQLLGVLPKSI